MVKRFGSISEMTIDTERDEILVTTIDGRVVVQSGVANREETLRDFKRVTFRPADLLLELTVPWGDVLEIEVYDQDDHVARRAGRPVIYLDQNKWVQLAQAVNAPDKLTTPDLDAASLLLDMAEKKEVLLPLSSGHNWIETGGLDRPLEGAPCDPDGRLVVGLGHARPAPCHRVRDRHDLRGNRQDP